ncbi:STAS domain-containing protein [Chitinispirillales bacterium ANBcel5]|uniref:STAS domain-containing protein n=1 Tax=Cellulosispirillum alkaliphilum TaxID=3039283 RepID=UPI002A56FAC8|nr:STAS domain-containing protein [Chitinispirillales bacterium ANBcel5]
MQNRESIPLEVELSSENDRPILKLVGSIIDVDVKKFQRKLDQLYKKKYKEIVLDVSRSNYIDSHGLGTIVYYHTLMQKEKRELTILNTNTDEASYINKLFDLTNLNRVLKIVTQL